MKSDFSFEAKEIEGMKIKECACGNYHLEAPDWRLHLSEEALRAFFLKLELAMDIVQKRRTPHWLRAVYQGSPK